MINKLGIAAAIIAMLSGATEYAKPSTILKNAAGHNVYIYELPQQEKESDIEQLMVEELKDLPTLNVEQLLVDDIAGNLLEKVNSGFSKLCGARPWDTIGIPVNYLDVRLTERIALTIRGVAMLSAMNYLDGTDLEKVYQQWGFTAEQAKKLKDRYQKLFAPLCQQMRLAVTKISNPPTQQQAEQLLTLSNKFEQCFTDHFFIIFNTTRKALAAEHNALLQEIGCYNDGQLLEAEYKKICEAFKKSAPWLTDTSADETLSSYARHCDVLSDDEKKAIELCKQKNPDEVPTTEDLNLMKIVSETLPLIAIRAIHSIIHSQKAVALFILDPSIQEQIVNLLRETGYNEVTAQG